MDQYSYSQYTPQLQKINKQFHKEIRKNDIERRFAQRRKLYSMLISNEKQNNQANNKSNVNQQVIEPLLSTPQIVLKLQEILRKFYTQQTFGRNQLRQLMRISCTMAGALYIINLPQKFIFFLVQEYFYKIINSESCELQWTLLLLNNCLTVSNSVYASTAQLCQYKTSINNIYNNNIQKLQVKNSNNSYTSTYPFSHIPNIHNSQQQPSLTTSLAQNTCFLLNNISITNKFLQNLFLLITNTEIEQIKSLSLSTLFCIVYNNDYNLIDVLINSPNYLVINVLYNEMHNQPSKIIIIQCFRCYFIMLKKINESNCVKNSKCNGNIVNNGLSYNNYTSNNSMINNANNNTNNLNLYNSNSIISDSRIKKYPQLLKMRKFIIFAVRNNNTLQVSMISVLCLLQLIKIVQSQAMLILQSDILNILLQRTLKLKNSKLTAKIIMLVSSLMDNKQVASSAYMKDGILAKNAVDFIQKCMEVFTDQQCMLYCLKLLYDMQFGLTSKVDKWLAKQNYKLLQKILQIFQSKSSTKQILVQAAYCLSITVSKNKQIQKSTMIRIKQRIEYIIEEYGHGEKQGGIERRALEYLEQTVDMLKVFIGNYSQNSQIGGQ